MGKDTGLTDNRGNIIREGDVLVRRDKATPEWTKKDIAKMKADAGPNVMFGLLEIPHPKFPARTYKHKVVWDGLMAQWDVPRDYDGAPDLEEWNIAPKEKDK